MYAAPWGEGEGEVSQLQEVKRLKERLLSARSLEKRKDATARFGEAKHEGNTS